MNYKPLAVAFLILTLAAVAVHATVPNDWASGSFYIPNCSAQVNVKHYEVAVGPGDVNGVVAAYDAMKAKGWTNLRFVIQDSRQSVWSGDCGLAT